jgi:choline kinase
MKAVILAAGLGTRLGTLIPKPLTSIVDEKTILDFQIENLTKSIGPNSILAVVGYKKEIIMEKHPELLYVYNHGFAHTNTGKSLLAALEKVDDDVIWVNGDVYFDASVIELLVACDSSACLVNKAKVGDEEIKYSTADGHIKLLSKAVEKAEGEAVGINLIRRADLPKFVAELRKIDDKDYFEKALENLTVAGRLRLKPVDLAGKFCHEIDFPEDLKKVQHHIGTQES